jgi:hypothetical protein
MGSLMKSAVSHARSYAVLLALALAACGVEEGRLVPSKGVLAKAQATTEHPLSGFWEYPDCSKEWGLAIGPMSTRTYFVSFCTEFDCFAEGTYRPETPIYGDPSYRVIDANSIDVLGDRGFTRYIRCPTLVPRPKPDA